MTDDPDPTLFNASFAQDGIAVVVGSRGATGGALLAELSGSGSFKKILGLARTTDPPLDLAHEDTIAAAAEHVASQSTPLRLVIDATGFLHRDSAMPEKTWRHLDSENLAHAFAVNAIGPALLIKHFAPLLARDGKAVFATLSARVGSIGDNQLGGWYGYRASKAALNQIVRTAAVELRRRSPAAVCVALHPGTVDSALSAPFDRANLHVRSPAVAAKDLISVIENLDAADTGTFVDYRGTKLPW